MKILSIVKNALMRLLKRKNGVFYINGPETLPPPLTHAEEADIISRLQSEPSLRAVLVERNLRLVVYIAKKFENTGTGIEDLISIGTIGLIKAINTFNAEKNIKLATYASRCIENEILMYIRKTSRIRLEMSIDEPLNTDWDGNELLLSDVLGGDEDTVYRNMEVGEDKKTIEEALSKLSEREQTIIRLRFGMNGGDELTQKEVADLLGISQSYISRLEKKIISRLRKEIETKI
ncbi:MAG: RNA polymerase sporulation sigma factor SigE [Clostridia bacterium]|nr:RNA polymerase sporulation sigma factor SigE [Clostridia bacterium]